MTLMYFTALFFFVSLEVDSRNTMVSGLAKVAIFTTNDEAENQTLINHLGSAETEHWTATFVKPVLAAVILF